MVDLDLECTRHLFLCSLGADPASTRDSRFVLLAVLGGRVSVRSLFPRCIVCTPKTPRLPRCIPGGRWMTSGHRTARRQAVPSKNESPAHRALFSKWHKFFLLRTESPDKRARAGSPCMLSCVIPFDDFLDRSDLLQLLHFLVSLVLLELCSSHSFCPGVYPVGQVATWYILTLIFQMGVSLL